MYHCRLQFYLLNIPREIAEILRAEPPLERFTHVFTESAGLDPALAGQADVVLAHLPGGDGLSALAPTLREDAQLILLGGWEGLPAAALELPQLAGLWPASVTEDMVRLQFRQWQKGCKRDKDLWQAEQFLNACINGAPNLIWFKDKDGIHEKVNDSFCQVVGKTHRQVEGRTHAYIWDVEEDDPACIESEREVMQERKTCVSNEVVQTGSGQRLLTTYKSPVYDLDGIVAGTVGVAIDVTQERAYEQAITEKNRTMEMLFSTMDCGVMCHSLDGKRVISVNQAALRLLGYSSQEELLADGFNLVAQSVADEDKPKLRASITSLKKPEDSVSVEYRVQHADGSVLHILGNVKLVEEGGELFYQRFLLDFTAQKLREEAKWAQKDWEMQYQERVFEIFSTFLSDNVDDIYMMLDEWGKKAEFISPNVERVLGLSRSALMENLQILDQAKYFTGGRVSREDLKKLKPGMSLERMETERVNHQTGERRWFQESVHCVSLQGVKKIIVYISDRTQERQTQDTLTEALEMAQVANRAKSTFLSNVSHDIRTPMNVIMGFLTLLGEEADNPKRVREYAQKIAAASQHLLELINDVLDMNKIESGSAVLNITGLRLADLIDEVNTIIRPQAREKGQTFEIQTDSLTCEYLLGDKLRINQIMINILSNAVKYTPSGGKITMKVTELPQVDKNYSRIRFVVRDNGQGMSEEYQRVLFDPFTREEVNAWHQIQGTGLGMAITKSLVDLMGGTIRVESQMGKGSVFTVELELRVQEQEEDPDFWKRYGIARMIVADDDEDICRDIAKKMAGGGVVTQYATRGEQAVEMVRAARERGEPFDLILLDWKMPGLNGLETARLIQKSAPEKPPILLFTAYDWVDVEQEAMEAGIEHFLAKPFFMSSFKETIQRMLGGEQKTALSAGGEGILTDRHVLVVDDIALNRTILVKILTTLGAVCDEAENGQAALEKFEASPAGRYDLILMDIQMPVLDGYAATRAIRASTHPSARSIAIVAMTANAFVDDIRDALDSGMDGHISKPIVLEQLKGTIQQVLERKSQEN